MNSILDFKPTLHWAPLTNFLYTNCWILIIIMDSDYSKVPLLFSSFYHVNSGQGPAKWVPWKHPTIDLHGADQFWLLLSLPIYLSIYIYIYVEKLITIVGLQSFIYSSYIYIYIYNKEEMQSASIEKVFDCS